VTVDLDPEMVQALLSWALEMKKNLEAEKVVVEQLLKKEGYPVEDLDISTEEVTP